MLPSPFASPEQIAAEALSALLPKKRENVADHALGHRWLPGASGSLTRWRHELVPYTVEPMCCLDMMQHLTVAVVGPGQVAKTVIPENWLLKSVASDPADFLWYMQTDDAVEAYVKGRINPMIDTHPAMRDNQGQRPVDDSLHFKNFRDMKAEFLSATLKNLINKSAPRIVGDEIDAWVDMGDVKVLLDIRRQRFGLYSKIFAASHPDKAKGMVPERDWLAGIMQFYADSDRRMWYWRCPHCHGVSSPCPAAPRHMSIAYPIDGTLDEIEREAHLLCPINGCVIGDHERRQMNIDAFHSSWRGWIGEGQEIAADGTVTGELVPRLTAGFWIVGPMSPFIIGGIGGLARARVKAERELEISGEDETLRQVIVKQWGIPYTPPRSAGSIDAGVLADRAEPDLKLGFVPDWVRFLVAVVDCQRGFFEYLVRGFGEKGESCIVDAYAPSEAKKPRGRILADPATSPDDWDKLIELFARVYPLVSDPTRGMKIRGCGYDSAGEPGVTLQAYAAWTRWKRLGKVRLFGRIGGRDVYSIIPCKGMPHPNVQKLAVVYPDTMRKANIAAGAGTVPQAQFNANLFKDDLAGQLLRAEPGAGYVHFPGALRSKEPPHAFFEQVASEHKLPNGKWEKINLNARNEALDLMVMSHVVAHLHGLNRINWDRPPVWAAPQGRNSYVVPLSSVPPPTAEPTGPSVTTDKKSIAQKLA